MFEFALWNLFDVSKFLFRMTILSFISSPSFNVYFKPVMKIIAFVTLLISFTNSLAQYPPVNFYKITNNEGLSQATVNVIYKDSEGYIWIGTDDGLNRFDGKNIKTSYYLFNDPSTLAANEIYGICEDRHKRLWLAHYNAGISIYDKAKDRFIRFDQVARGRNALNSNQVYGLATDSEGNIWARTVKGISNINADDFTVRNFDHPAFADNNISSHIDIIEHAGYIWFGSTNKGLLRIRKDGRSDLPMCWDTKNFGSAVSGILPDGQALLVSSEKGLFRVENRNATAEVIPIIKDSLLFLTAGKLLKQKNTPLVWMAAGRGILIVNVDEKKLVRHLKSETISDNLLSNIIHCLIQDNEENIIIGTNRGLNISSPFSNIFNNYENIFRKIPGFGHPVYAIQERMNGDLLLGTKNGGAWYFNLKTEKAEHLDFPWYPASELRIYKFIPENDHLYLVCTSKGLWELSINGEKKQIRRPLRFPELKQLDALPLTDFLFDGDSTAYISSIDDGFFKWQYKKKSITQYTRNAQTPKKGPVNNQVLNLVPGKDKTVILCTEYGFSIYYPTQDSFLNVLPGKHYPNELPARNIKDAYDDGNHIWLATFGAGVQKYYKQTRSFSGYTMTEGLPNNSVYAVTPDDHGNIWIPTNNGLALLQVKSGAIRTFTTGDGLPDNEFNAYASHKASSGNIFFSTLNGIVHTRTTFIVNNPYLPEMVLTHFEASSKNKDSVITTYGRNEIRLPVGFNSLYLQFAALSFADPDKNQYKIKLENFDKDWLDVKNRHYQRYTNLPPGEYVFKATGSNNSNKWSNKMISIKVTIAPFWYQTTLFKTLLVIVAASLLYGLYRYRLNEVLKVERLRQKISRDLHDDIGSTLSSINIYSELAKNDQNNKWYLDIIQQHTQGIIGSLDDLVWSINPKNDSLDVLVNRMQSFAQPLLSAKKIRYDFEADIENAHCAITLEQRASLYLAFKEMVNNVVKHAAADYCSIQVKQKGRSIGVSVKDNGKGIPPDRMNNNRNGLKNLRDRATQLNGTFNIVSPVEGGTEVSLRIVV